jgi:integrase/recombinase XerD
MDITVYTRHVSSCSHKGDRHWRRCRCPKWLYYTSTWKRVSAKTNSWERAETLAKRLSNELAAGLATPIDAVMSEPAPADPVMTLEQAVNLYLEDKKEQQAGDALTGKLTRLLKVRLIKFCANEPTPPIAGVPLPVLALSDVSLRHLEEFRKTWPGGGLTKKKMQELLRAFFGYCVNHDWIRLNPAKLLSKIAVDEVPTDYFPPEEFGKILAACNTYPTKSTQPALRREKVKALALLMRWSGLRAGDAMKFERMRLNGNKLLLRMEKTGTPVSCLIPPEVADLLRKLPNSNPRYFFWSGKGSADSVYSDWHRTFEKVFAEANLGKRCHFHMFRDTFAIELLLVEVPIEQVSVLLGHRSIRVTEKHYSPWVHARQEQLEASVQKAWRTGESKPKKKDKKAAAAR